MISGATLAATTATLKTAFSPPAAAAAAAVQRSPWHSPVPYLFGGLAAMLGLIAFALLLLACSYWRLSGRLNNRERTDDQERDLEAGGDDDKKVIASKSLPIFEEKIVVIMAGDLKPSFLATPSAMAATYKASSTNEDGSSKSGESTEKNREDHGVGETDEDKPKLEVHHHGHDLEMATSTENGGS